MPGSVKLPGLGGPVVLDLMACDPALLRMADEVVSELLVKSPQLQVQDLMIVGAHCRDILQSAMGQELALSATDDIDFGLALANWTAYDELTGKLDPTGHTGIRYWVANVPTDLMPFGAVEEPPGMVTPPARHESMSVWGFSEVFAVARPLELPRAGIIRIPTVAGYAALKLAAWLDRSAYGKYKDAADIATVLYWYSESPDIKERLWEAERGQEVLMQEEMDDTVASARLLGEDIAEAIGTARLSELAERWPGRREDSLYAGMTVRNAVRWPTSLERRQDLVRAMERGLAIRPTPE
jgi:predicted nucleotidyltransferase